MSTNKLGLGWLGLGSMGLAMAKNLQTHLKNIDQPALRYYNRTSARGEPVAKLGGISCSSVVELVNSCDIIFLSLSDDAALETIINQIIKTGGIQEKIFVDTTTVHPNTTSRISSRIQQAQASYVAASVFGSTPTAEAGQLLMAVAGSSSAITTISPFLKGVLARNIIEVGTEPSKALLLKTTSNFITAGLHYLVSEAHVLAEKSGLPAPVLETLVQENFGQYVGGVSQRMTHGIYYPAAGGKPFSSLELGMKDVGIGLGIASDVDMQLQVGNLVMQHMEQAKRFGDAKGRALDSSSVFGAVRQNAGLDFETDGVKERDTKST